MSSFVFQQDGANTIEIADCWGKVSSPMNILKIKKSYAYIHLKNIFSCQKQAFLITISTLKIKWIMNKLLAVDHIKRIVVCVTSAISNNDKSLLKPGRN